MTARRNERKHREDRNRASKLGRKCKGCGADVPTSRPANAKFCSCSCAKRNERPRYVKQQPLSSPNASGALAELFVAADLLGKGFNVFRAVLPGASCDLVAERSGLLCRIEVKKAMRHANGTIGFAMKQGQKEKHDVLALYFHGESGVEYRPAIESWFFVHGPVEKSLGAQEARS